MSIQAVTPPSWRSEFMEGARLGVPVFVASAPFAMLFGVVAIENGFTALEAVLMSAMVFGGASQLVGVELFGHQAAGWLIVLSIFAVNFRHVLYSAAIGRHLARWNKPQQVLAYFLLTDPQYALTETRAFHQQPGFAWYLGLALPMYGFWVLNTGIGAWLGMLIPDMAALGIDFLLPIYFLGLVMDFRQRPLWLPIVAVSAISSIIAHQTIGSPWHVSIGGLAGVILAVIMPPRLSGITASGSRS
ncbi:AzlC family ABC transporter permease [Aquamicrobium segne]|uniref:AzlC family ABC transporter permease n=1 Tax=Aquamicrobium segne TaxID=469547 RepID=A0ABW0H2C0_9HYPH